MAARDSLELFRANFLEPVLPKKQLHQNISLVVSLSMRKGKQSDEIDLDIPLKEHRIGFKGSRALKAMARGNQVRVKQKLDDIDCFWFSNQTLPPKAVAAKPNFMFNMHSVLHGSRRTQQSLKHYTQSAKLEGRALGGRSLRCSRRRERLEETASRQLVRQRASLSSAQSTQRRDDSGNPFYLSYD
jgi:hypothetical protein